jgi:DNA-binding transcriptional LysR family regulator
MTSKMRTDTACRFPYWMSCSRSGCHPYVILDMKVGLSPAATSAAVIELGSFDAAAERLHVTPSAVSQRIKALEQRVGQVLVVREKPCTATAAGAPLLRLAAQTALLESEAMAEMGGSEGTAVRIALAVNADSMATWFTGVFRTLGGVLFDIRIEDQDHSMRLLREGVVMGAVTTERAPVPGCQVQSLGVCATFRWPARRISSGISPTASPRTPWPRRRRWPGIATMRYRMNWCERLFAVTSPGRSISCRQLRDLRPRCAGFGVGHVPRQRRRTTSGRRIVRAGLRCAPRRPAVLAVLEFG